MWRGWEQATSREDPPRTYVLATRTASDVSVIGGVGSVHAVDILIAFSSTETFHKESKLTGVQNLTPLE